MENANNLDLMLIVASASFIFGWVVVKAVGKFFKID